MPMTLYQIKETYQYFLQQVENGEVPEEYIADTLESIEGEFDEKADNIACFIKELVAGAKALKDEIDNLTLRMKTKQAKADKLTEYLFKCMESLNMKKLETPRNLLQIKQNPPSVEVGPEFISWAMSNREDLLSYKEPTPDKAAIKEALKYAELPGCSITQKERLVIK